jgi:hypothetical protein
MLTTLNLSRYFYSSLFHSFTLSLSCFPALQNPNQKLLALSRICVPFFLLVSISLLGLAPIHDAAAADPVQFVEVTLEAGIDFTYVNGASGRKYMPECMGSGAALFDYDNDGTLDLYIVNGAPLPGFQCEEQPTNALYRNNGDGTFADVTVQAGVGDTGYGMGAAVGDYDNDGDEDLYVTNFGPNVLYRNNGDGTFTDVSVQAGVGDRGWGTNAAFVDYDQDGDLDLYVANYMEFDVRHNIECRQGTERAYCGPTTYPGQSGVLYRNDGDGRFTDVTKQAGLFNTSGRQLGTVFGDCDNDGDLDFFVANDKMPNFLFQNNGDGTFTETGLMAGIAYNEDGTAESAMGADLGDYDNDGYLDIIVATFQWLANTLYHNDGDGFFTDVTFPAHVGTESLRYLGMTAVFLDYDNDGYQDIFIANGHLDENVGEYDVMTCYAQKNQLFRNKGDGTFTEVTDAVGPGLRIERVSHGAAFGDYDNDGDVDIFVSDSDHPTCTLLRNDGGNRNHYLMIETVGTRSNRDGIGAKIRVVAGDLIQMKEVRSSYGYLCSNDVRVLFGLGDRDKADRIEVRWPSGMVQVLEDVRADQILTIKEKLP